MNESISLKLREKIFPIYRELFNQNNFENTCTFAVQWGEKFPKEKNKGLLFVGKAVNGWVTSNQNVDTLFDNNNSKRIFDRDDQMEWVNNHSGNTKGLNTRKSAFWRLIIKITRPYYSDKWYSHIAWTNLYKIAPSAGGNPNSKLQKQQKKYSFDILQQEIIALSPEYVIMLTSSWEWPFLKHLNKGEDLNVISEKKWGKYKTKLIKIEGTKYIVSHHPQGKKEWEHKQVIAKLIEEFEGLTEWNLELLIE